MGNFFNTDIKSRCTPDIILINLKGYIMLSAHVWPESYTWPQNMGLQSNLQYLLKYDCFIIISIIFTILITLYFIQRTIILSS